MTYARSLQQRIEKLAELIREKAAFDEKEISELVRNPVENIEQIMRLLLEKEVMIKLVKKKEEFLTIEAIQNELT